MYLSFWYVEMLAYVSLLIRADNREITAIQFQNVRAAVHGIRLCAVGVRVRAESAAKFNWRVHHGNNRICTGKRQEQNTSYSWFYALSVQLPCHIVAACLSHRKALAQAIRQYRKKAGMTQERLGESADLNPKYIGEVERMEKTISLDALARVAKALKVRLRDLVREA